MTSVLSLGLCAHAAVTGANSTVMTPPITSPRVFARAGCPTWFGMWPMGPVRSIPGLGLTSHLRRE